VKWLLVLLFACHEPKTNAAFDRYRQPEKLIVSLKLSAGEMVADVGAGSGYLTHRLAKAVGPTGRVVATDIDFAALQQIGAAKADEAPIEIRKVPPDQPSLEERAYDLVLLSEVDQYLPDRTSYLQKLLPALRPHGRIAVSNRRSYRAPVVDAANRAKLKLVGEYQELPAHFVLFFERDE
jgi:2-polyprenyl-3-methyl-5-hydroxy-6-metoxy-1,4-benzoquinol methylase